ncbi:hypothetical protein ACFL23_03365, partial [Patescibacteria group bacterium]
MIEDNIKIRKDEKILFVISPKFKFYLYKLILFFLLVLIPCFFWHFLIRYGYHGYLIIICSLLLASLYGAQSIIIYYYNVYIITN